MKSLRLGNFRSILDLLGPEGRDADDKAKSPQGDVRPKSRVGRAYTDSFPRMPDDRPEPSYVPLETLARLYAETEERPPPNPPPIRSADDDTIAAELRLSSARTGEDLRRIRRDFAMRNHPDRVPAWLREEATNRMRIANALIDKAMRDKEKKKARG